MRNGKRLALDILISAVFAIVAAAVGLVVGALLSFIVLFVLSRFTPGSESLGSWLTAVFLIFFPLLCGTIGGFFGFPLCGIWLDQRRHALRSNPLATSRIKSGLSRQRISAIFGNPGSPQPFPKHASSRIIFV
jgi:hypothetical protein